MLLLIPNAAECSKIAVQLRICKRIKVHLQSFVARKHSERIVVWRIHRIKVRNSRRAREVEVPRERLWHESAETQVQLLRQNRG